MAQRALIVRLPRRDGIGEVGQVTPGDRDGFGFVGHRDVDHTVRHLYVHRADIGGFVHTQPTAFDHGRTAHADVGVRGRDDDVAAAEYRGVAGKALARRDSDERNQTAQAGKEMERHGVEPGYPGRVGVAGPPPAPFGEEHHRTAQPLGQLEQSILLAVVLEALGAGQHGVVVRQHHGRMATHVADTCHEPVARCALDQLFDASSSALGGERQRAVLDEGAVVAQVIDVLAGCALTARAPSGDGVGPLLVAADGMARHDFGQVSSFSVEIDRVDRGHVVVRMTGRVEVDERGALQHGVADRRQHLDHDAGGLGRDDMLHLHRLDDDQWLRRRDGIAGRHRHRDDRSLQGRCQYDSIGGGHGQVLVQRK